MQFAMESISPELALVDPALRTRLAAELAEPDDCLSAPVEVAVTRSSDPHRPAALPDVARRARRSPSRLVPRPAAPPTPAAPRAAAAAAAAPALAPSLDVGPAPSPVRLVPPVAEPEAVLTPLPEPGDPPSVPGAADAAARTRPARIAARVAVVGVLVSAPFVGPVIVDLIQRV